jgi:hypothetical protein
MSPTPCTPNFGEIAPELEILPWLWATRAAGLPASKSVDTMSDCAPLSRTWLAARGATAGSDLVSALTSSSCLPRTPPAALVSSTASCAAANTGPSHVTMKLVNPIAAPMAMGSVLPLLLPVGSEPESEDPQLAKAMLRPATRTMHAAQTIHRLVLISPPVCRSLPGTGGDFAEPTRAVRSHVRAASGMCAAQ